MAKDAKNGTLTVVGLGIKFLSHLTIEAKAHIEQADKVLYLVNNPAMKEWIHDKNPNAESLERFYLFFSKRSVCYTSIAQYIIKNLENNQHVCVALYGHPAVLAQPGLIAVEKAHSQGYDAKILPGISAEDCLFADLLVNPGDYGLQSYDVTDFLIRKYPINVNSHLILWQINVIGILEHRGNAVNRRGLFLLKEQLIPFYLGNYKLILYEAAQYPRFKPKVKEIYLKDLDSARISASSILYIPPKEKPSYNETMLTKLGIDICDLEKGR